ncbi:MAG: GH92 family glycosyl hydrolase [Rikenellaceae bacterium]|jgi:predicted alpha-1,2-mannosidase|nr:GH92 family glycosyl hydrolase [Rikenellaceae bacterium]
MKHVLLLVSLLCLSAREPVEWVDPFIGTTNKGVTNPGAVCPNGMASVVPYNVTGSTENRFDKDSLWWSAPYEYRNVWMTGLSHVNLSGVGCPDLGSLLLMATTGRPDVDYRSYGSRMARQQASPGYYSVELERYGVRVEATATTRCGVTRFTFPAGQANLLLNLGAGLTNESGAMARMAGECEVEGMKLLGTFCYNPQAVFPVYFVMRLSKAPARSGYWKKQRPTQGVSWQWDTDQGKYKIYSSYFKEIAGDDVGAWFSFDTQAGEQIEARIGISFVSIDNARMNLEAEAAGRSFDELHAAARGRWNADLGRIRVEGGSEAQKTVFYTALYHTLIHPNVLNDVNGQYPAMENPRIMTTEGTRYTVFSLWDTYRNVHQLLTLVYPERQAEMVRSMIGMYDEWGWTPKWELFGRETWTMEGDPSIPVIVDTWLKGVRGYDIQKAYGAFRKSAFTPGIDTPEENVLEEGEAPDSYYSLMEGGFNRMRPDNSDYMRLGYVPLRRQWDNSVSHSLEYYIADYALSLLADSLGHVEEAALLRKRSQGWRNYYDPSFGTFRPLLADGSFYSPFDPTQGMDFEPNPGFHEGCAWNYTFYVPHDVAGLCAAMGGRRRFVERLESVFDRGYYDPANEPDIAYPYLFSYFPGEEWRTQRRVTQLLEKHFTAAPDGIPGNDDAGAMSAWALFSMMGFYPDCPGKPEYTLTTPVFDRIEITLDPTYFPVGKLVIKAVRKNPDDNRIEGVSLGGRALKGRRITHERLVRAGVIEYSLKPSIK